MTDLKSQAHRYHREGGTQQSYCIKGCRRSAKYQKSIFDVQRTEIARDSEAEQALLATLSLNLIL